MAGHGKSAKIIVFKETFGRIRQLGQVVVGGVVIETGLITGVL